MVGRARTSTSVARGAAVTVALLAAACGSGDGEGAGPSEEEYLRDANAVCAEVEERVAEIGEEFSAEIDAAQGQLPSDARMQELYGELLGELDAMFARVRGLDGPDDLEADVAELLDDVEAQLAETRRQIEDDFDGFVDQEEDPFADLAPRFIELGLDDCAAT